MNICIACLSTETNSFSPIPTGRESFADGMIAHGDGTAKEKEPFSAPLHVWKHMAEKDGHYLFESLTAHAQPGGPTVRSVYEEFREEILFDIKGAVKREGDTTVSHDNNPDIILLALHGAMIADGYEDCEGDLLRKIRVSVGQRPVIAALLDPHAHLTEAMLDAASILIAYKEYPHTDIPDRAEELYSLAIKAAKGEVRPVMRDFDCKMVFSYLTTYQPIRGFVDDMIAQEQKEETLSVSLIHSFPWGDSLRTGTRTLVITDNATQKASFLSKKLGTKLFSIRKDIRSNYLSIDRALTNLSDSAFFQPSTITNEGPIVLADVSDNAGGGAPSDSTFLLRAILEKGISSVAAGIIWDPIALRFCCEAEEGAKLSLRLGGKCGPVSGTPLDLDVKVMKLSKDIVQYFGSIPSRIGKSARLRVLGKSQKTDLDIDLIVNDLRTQIYHPSVFTSHGIDLKKKRLIVVKSTQHFYAGFSPIATEVRYVATPGAITPDFATIPYRRKTGSYWPKVDNPFE